MVRVSDLTVQGANGDIALGLKGGTANWVIAIASKNGVANATPRPHLPS